MKAQEGQLLRRTRMTRKTQTSHLLATSQVQTFPTAATTPAEVRLMNIG